MGNSICNCNFKQDQPEENLYQKQLQQFSNLGIPMNTNAFSEQVNLNNFSTPASKHDQSNIEYSRSLYNYSAKSKPMTLSKEQQTLYSKQKFQLDQDQFISIIRIQSNVRDFLKKLKLSKKKNVKSTNINLVKQTNKVSPKNEVKSLNNYMETKETNKKDKVKSKPNDGEKDEEKGKDKEKEKIKFEKTQIMQSFGHDNYTSLGAKNLKIANPYINETFGIQIWKDGAIYKGSFKKIEEDKSNQKVNYENQICIANPNLYKAQGLGTFTHVEGDVYKGEFVNDETNGFGLYYHLNGATYEGYWKEDNQCGFGIEEWADGSTFEGQYYMGMKEGIGTYNWSDGSSYLGEWKKNNLDGYGIYKFSDGRVYLGQWLENSMHGFGEFLWDDGKKYVGYYVEDKKEGFGMYMWNHPVRIYVGFWSNGKQHGVGKYIAVNYCKWGIWENGKRKTWLKSKDEALGSLDEISKKFSKIMLMDGEQIARLMMGGSE